MGAELEELEEGGADYVWLELGEDGEGLQGGVEDLLEDDDDVELELVVVVVVTTFFISVFVNIETLSIGHDLIISTR